MTPWFPFSSILLKMLFCFGLWRSQIRVCWCSGGWWSIILGTLKPEMMIPVDILGYMRWRSQASGPCAPTHPEYRVAIETGCCWRVQKWEKSSVSASQQASHLLRKKPLKSTSNITLSIEVLWIWFQMLCLIVRQLCILAVIFGRDSAGLKTFSYISNCERRQTI